jgi:hypothetical protein
MPVRLALCYSAISKLIRSPVLSIATSNVEYFHFPADFEATTYTTALPFGPEIGIAKSAFPDEPLGLTPIYVPTSIGELSTFSVAYS